LFPLPTIGAKAPNFPLDFLAEFICHEAFGRNPFGQIIITNF
jgi:hypothetical protein